MVSFTLSDRRRGARMYAPDEGRWKGVDALGEKRNSLSPYNYVQNNPMLRVDPDGNLDDPYLVFDGNKKKLSIYDDNDTPDDYSDDIFVNSYDAHNNVASTSKGKWEDGEYEMLDKNTRFTHPDAYENDGTTLQDSGNGRYGEDGIYRAKNFKETNGDKITRSGMAVHAGRENKVFENRKTMGCVRTTPEAMKGIDKAISKYGPLQKLIVKNNLNSAKSDTVNKVEPGKKVDSPISFKIPLIIAPSDKTYHYYRPNILP